MPRKVTLASLKKKLWKVFSKYIRLKYADENGMVNCFTCGRAKHWKEIQAGHYIPKSLGLQVYFVEQNVHPQCVYCNKYMRSNATAYAIELRKKYGEGILDELDKIKHTDLKLSKFEYLEMITHYQLEVHQLLWKTVNA